MTDKQLAAFIENQASLLEDALEKSDKSMVGVDRHELFEYIGNNPLWALTGLTEDEHRDRNPLDWSQEQGSVKVLDPIRNEIEAMNEMVLTLRNGE